ncbi:virulence protein RhuM/Fic/DOC family protein [uncultured Duncaniella sp.]|uniref:virulence protein RhuM/Fic/DOC family protein n=1 Tax=uncultured Duncaniella sp. TaxID=2768039 RepID=UPI0025DB38B9|nr:virulence protein RhuM/Fic/DOC family protein [uncultured Duncaniella sp.]
MEGYNNSQLVIYQSQDGNLNIDVTLQNDTVWLSQNQMSELFDKDQSVIARHISNVFKEGELEKESNMQILHNTLSKYKPTQVYSLDVIISVGYRVKSKRGTQFRIWANKVLKQYLLNGYAVNERIASQKFDELSQLVKVLGRTIRNQEKLTDDSRSLLEVVVDYTYALDTLDRYDYQELKIEETTGKEEFHATYENAMEVIRELHEKFGGSSLFGNEKDDSFKSSIGQIYQTFGGVDLYPSVEEKAAMLLYLVTKNHSFSDGNKRIAATLFLWFLNGNGILYNEDGTKRIADNTLVALTLMIAESRTEEKDTMVKVVVNLINKNN